MDYFISRYGLLSEFIRHQSETAGAFLLERRWFLVSGKRSIPAGGAGEHPELLLDGEDHNEGRCGVSVHL